MDARERTVLYYLPPTGPPAPFKVWRDAVSDMPTKAAVDARIARLRGGNFGDSKAVGKGVSETRIDFGPGFRIYYGIDGDNIVLLKGGDKSSQDADIEEAKDFWKDYKERKKSGQRPGLSRRSPRQSTR